MRKIFLVAAVVIAPMAVFAQNPEGARGGAVAIIGDQTPRFKPSTA